MKRYFVALPFLTAGSTGRQCCVCRAVLNSRLLLTNKKKIGSVLLTFF